jgi:ribosomal protein S18 acetylase RimI-like enzyme
MAPGSKMLRGGAAILGATMKIRPAELEDLQACLDLDHSFLTDHVWQMDVQEGKLRVAVNFRTVRLPRPVHVKYPRDRDALLAEWHRRDCFLVATLSEPRGEDERLPIIGYLTMGDYGWHKTGWIADLVVAPERRRQGVATKLLLAGAVWAREAGLCRLTIETQTKNHPALRFLDRQGFSFCGYNDRYYANQDIALFFSLDLR